MSNPNPTVHKCDICQAECELTCGACRDAWYCCLDHQKEAWKRGHKKICLTKADKLEILAKAREDSETHANATEARGWAEEYEQVLLQRAFVNDHPFPEEERIRQFILTPPTNSRFFEWGYARMMKAPGFYRHSLAVRLYQAIAMEDWEEQIQEYRSIGYLLHKRGGKEMMQCYYYMIFEMLHGTAIWPEPRDPNLGYWIFQYVEIYWNKIGAWKW